MRFGALLGLAGIGLVLGVPRGALAATPVATPQGHEAEDNVSLTPREEAQLSHESSVKNAAARAKVAAVTGSPDVVGQWGPVVEWPVVARPRRAAPERKVLAYDSVGDKATESYRQDHTRATVWDPATGTQTPVNVNNGFNIFCSGLAHLSTATCSSPAATRTSNSTGSSRRTLRLGEQHLEPGSEHGRPALVPDGHADGQRRDADHLRRARHSRGAPERRLAAQL